MAKVTIIIEDMTDSSGVEGMGVEMKFEPEWDGNTEPTVAQRAAAAIAQYISVNSQKIEYVEDDGTIEVLKDDSSNTEVH